MNVRDVEVGQPLDVLVAEKVMGWTIHSRTTEPCCEAPRRNPADGHTCATCAASYVSFEQTLRWAETGGDFPLQEEYWPPFSTTGNGMLLVLERMRELGWHFDLYSDEIGFQLTNAGSPATKGFGARFVHYADDRIDEDVWADSLPEAVCRAALKAMEARDDAR